MKAHRHRWQSISYHKDALAIKSQHRCPCGARRSYYARLRPGGGIQYRIKAIVTAQQARFLDTFDLPSHLFGQSQ